MESLEVDWILVVSYSALGIGVVNCTAEMRCLPKEQLSSEWRSGATSLR